MSSDMVSNMIKRPQAEQPTSSSQDVPEAALSKSIKNDEGISTATKKHEQNRRAQRAYRQRQKEHVRELEESMLKMQEQHAKEMTAKQCKIRVLEARLAQLTGSSSTERFLDSTETPSSFFKYIYANDVVAQRTDGYRDMLLDEEADGEGDDDFRTNSIYSEYDSSPLLSQLMQQPLNDHCNDDLAHVMEKKYKLS